MIQKKTTRLKLKIQRIKLISFYKNYEISNYKNLSKVNELFTTCFTLSLPKRQHFFNFFKILENKRLNFSTGVFLNLFGKRAKFFKRSPKNVTGLVLQFKKHYLHFFKYLYICNIKNFNYRQFLFFKKLLELLQPTIQYLWHKQSYIPRFSPQRRIKRKIVHLLKKL